MKNLAPSGLRDLVIDIARGIAILLVVIGHSLEIGFNSSSDFGLSFPAETFEAWRIIYAFHMPLFYFVSGMSYRIENASFLKVFSGSCTLIILAYLTSVVAAAIIYLVKPPADGFALALFIKPLITGYQMNLVVTWFLISLAFVQIISWFYYRYGAFVKIFTFAFCLLVYIALDLADKNYYYGKTWIVGVIFFILGREIAKRGLHQRLAPGAVLLGLGAAILVLFSTYGFNRGCTFSMTSACGERWGPGFVVVLAGGEIGNWAIFLVSAAAGVAAVILASILLRATAIAGLLSSIGKRTLAILLVNGIFVGFVRAPVTSWVTHDAQGLLLMAATVMIQVLLAYPLNGPVNRLRRSIDQVIQQRLAKHLPAG